MIKRLQHFVKDESEDESSFSESEEELNSNKIKEEILEKNSEKEHKEIFYSENNLEIINVEEKKPKDNKKKIQNLP
jgi:hypothetical protein